MITKEVEKTYTFLTQVLILNKKLLSASLLAHVCPRSACQKYICSPPWHQLSINLSLLTGANLNAGETV